MLRGLPYTIKETEIASFLHDVQLKQITLLHNAGGRLSGDAVVVVASEVDAHTALARTGFPLGHRYINVSRISKEQMDWHLGKNSKSDGTLRLKGLPFTVRKKDIEDFFEGLQIVPKGIGILTDKNQRPTGEAYVQFVSPEVANIAALKHKTTLGKRYIEISHSTLKAATNAIKQQMYVNKGVNPEKSRHDIWLNPHFTKDLCSLTSEEPMLGSKSFVSTIKEAAGYPYYAYFNSSLASGPCSSYTNDHVVRDTDLYSRSSHSSSQCRVHMRGLPYTATTEDVLSFFHPIEPLKICLRFGKNGKPCGMADVHFPTPETTKEAMKRHKSKMGPRYIELFSNVHK